MNITDIRIRQVKKEDTKLKAVASITIDECFVIHDIKIIEGREGLFLAMPSRKTPEGEFKDIVHPLNTETRESLRTAILAAYEKEQKSIAEGKEEIKATEEPKESK
ncbi:MAG: septation regulator SpoVG [Clostridia bacterium]